MLPIFGISVAIIGTVDQLLRLTETIVAGVSAHDVSTEPNVTRWTGRETIRSGITVDCANAPTTR